MKYWRSVFCVVIAFMMLILSSQVKLRAATWKRKNVPIGARFEFIGTYIDLDSMY